MLFDAVIFYFNDFHNTFRINNFDSYDEDIQSSTIIIHNILFMAGLVHVDSYILLVIDWYQKNQIPILRLQSSPWKKALFIACIAWIKSFGWPMYHRKTISGAYTAFAQPRILKPAPTGS